MKPGKTEAESRKPDGVKPGHLKTKFEVWGEEMIEKTVALSGKSGRIYVPLEWLGKNVKVIRVQ
jgi:putative transposon-encoded protein